MKRLSILKFTALAAAIAGLPVFGLPRTAQADARTECRQVWHEFTALMHKGTQEAQACSRSVIQRNLHRIVELQRENPDVTLYSGECTYAVKQSCAEIAQQCLAIRSARADAVQRCEQRASTEDQRRSDQQVPFKEAAKRTTQDTTSAWSASIPLELFKLDSPFKTVRDSLLLQNTGVGARAQRSFSKQFDTVNAIRLLLSGDQVFRERAAFSLVEVYGDRAITASNNPAAIVFSTYSFVALSNIREELKRELNAVKASIELFGVEQSLSRYQSDILFVQTQANWAATRTVTAPLESDQNLQTFAILQQFFLERQQLAAALAAEQQRRVEAKRLAEEARAQAAYAAEVEARDARARALARARAEAARQAAEAELYNDNYAPPPVYIPSTPILPMPTFIPRVPQQAPQPSYQQRPQNNASGGRSSCPQYRGRGTAVDCNP